jgi:hypothetical protein
MSIDTTDLKRYLALLETADAQIDRETAARFRATLEQLAAYARSIEHRRSGGMAESTVLLGPFPLGSGMLEGQILSGAFYTIFELAHGGEHDWASRTLDEQAALLEQLEQDTGRIVATAIGVA